jgi:hypothetical protein
MSPFDRSTRLLKGLSQVALIMFAAFAALDPVGGQDDLQPYTVYVDQEGVTARCGPGADYYRTDPLRHGQPLEVYVETEDGWLGIRPPDGSFCWLPADVVKLSPRQDFGVITEENSLAWIGTHLGKANKYLWQVQLAKGEEVAIVGRAKREGPDGMKLWYRIVPPAGEFRWVHRDQVVDNPELLLREKPRPGTRIASGRPTPAPEPEEFAEAAYDEPVRAPRKRSAEPASVLQNRVSRNRAEDVHPDNEPLGERVAIEDAQPLPLPIPRPEPTMAISNGPIAPPVVSDGPIGSGVVYDDTVNRAYEAPLVAFTTSPRVASIGTPYGQTENGRPDVAPPTEQLADAFQQRVGANPTVAPNVARTSEQQLYVDRSRVTIQSSVVPVSNVVPVSQPTELNKSNDLLQLELSRLMSRSAAAAEVDSIIASANALAQSGVTESERQRAAMILQRAQQYQLVARRREASTIEPTRSMASPPSYPAPVQSSVTAPAPAAVDVASGQEAAGYLVQVFSSRPDSPPYALTDSQGRTTHYVSAAPGVNLRRYLNQFITVRGSAGYSTGLDTPHIIATGAVRQ